MSQSKNAPPKITELQGMFWSYGLILQLATFQLWIQSSMVLSFGAKLRPVVRLLQFFQISFMLYIK